MANRNQSRETELTSSQVSSWSFSLHSSVSKWKDVLLESLARCSRKGCTKFHTCPLRAFFSLMRRLEGREGRCWVSVKDHGRRSRFPGKVHSRASAARSNTKPIFLLLDLFSVWILISSEKLGCILLLIKPNPEQWKRMAGVYQGFLQIFVNTQQIWPGFYCQDLGV